MNLDRKRLYKSPYIFEITRHTKIKPVFNVSQVKPCIGRKRANPFIVKNNSMTPMFLKKDHLNPIPSNMSKGRLNPIFNITQSQISTSNNTQIAKKVFVSINSGNQQHFKEEVKQESKFELAREEHFKMKVASIANELQSISQELDADYPSCKELSAFSPSMLNYWVNLQGYVVILNKIIQGIPLIQKKNSFH